MRAQSRRPGRARPDPSGRNYGAGGESGWFAAGSRRATLDDLHTTLIRLLTEQNTLFEAVWQRLTLAQRSVLRAVVLQNGRELLAADTRARHRLGGPSSIQASLAALIKQDLVLKEAQQYVVVDSLFREWVARKTF